MRHSKRFDDYLQLAADVVEATFLQAGKADPELDSAVAKFGVTLRQLGLKAAVTAWSAKQDDTRARILQAIHDVVQLHEKGASMANTTLLDIVNQNPNDYLLKKKILDAATALKLTFRLYQ